MKNLKYILLPILFLGVFACEEDLEIEPEQSLSTSAAFSDENTALASLVGVYGLAQGIDVFGSRSAVISEYWADNVRFVGSFPTLQEINNYVTIATNGTIRGIWREHYEAILAANAVITNMPNVDDPGLSEEERSQYIAEAKFMRGLFYFNLVTLFGQPYNVSNGATDGVPLVLEPNILEGSSILPGRNSVAEVYDQIERDLTEALPNLPESYASADQTRGRATQGAANGFLARLNLYKENWASVITFSDAVLNNSGLYALASDYSFWDGNTSEDVFSIQNSSVDPSSWDLYYLPADRGGRGDAPYSDDLLAIFEQDKDLRFTTLSFSAVDAAGNDAIFPNKFPDGVGGGDNAPLMRTTEVVLNKAEALVKSTQTVNEEAIALINPLLERAGLETVSAADFASSDELLDRILLERRKELCFEGHRRMDLLRNGLPLRASGAGEGISNPGDPLVVLPIPQRDIDLGSSTPQNPGY